MLMSQHQLTKAIARYRSPYLKMVESAAGHPTAQPDVVPSRPKWVEERAIRETDRAGRILSAGGEVSDLSDDELNKAYWSLTTGGRVIRHPPNTFRQISEAEPDASSQMPWLPKD